MLSIESDDSLTSKVVEAVHGAIIAGELTPGTLYSVNALAEELSVSRTPVREAMIQLAAQGMVRFEKNRGIRILQISVHDLEEAFSLRLLLEVPATLRATELFGAAERSELRRIYTEMVDAADARDEPKLMRHDRRFHSLLLEGSGNLRLAQVVDGLRDMVLLRGLTSSPRRSLRDIVHEHEPILTRVEAGDSAGAACAMREHLLHTASLLIAQGAGAGAEDGVAEALVWTSGRTNTTES
jgi:DNA-binding GntR family transcriptional regulator